MVERTGVAVAVAVAGMEQEQSAAVPAVPATLSDVVSVTVVIPAASVTKVVVVMLEVR